MQTKSVQKVQKVKSIKPLFQGGNISKNMKGVLKMNGILRRGDVFFAVYPIQKVANKAE
jgi:hypothetical protein